MTKPLTMSWLPSPLAPLTNCARPTVPPAPATLMTCTLLTSFSAISACCIERAVWSQPPPGAAGAMIFSSSLRRTPESRTAASPRSARRGKSLESDNDMSGLLELPRAIKGRFCGNVQCRRVDVGPWPSPRSRRRRERPVPRPSWRGRARRCDAGKRPNRRMMSACSSAHFTRSASPVAGNSAQHRSWSASVSECSNGR